MMQTAGLTPEPPAMSGARHEALLRRAAAAPLAPPPLARGASPNRRRGVGYWLRQMTALLVIQAFIVLYFCELACLERGAWQRLVRSALEPAASAHSLLALLSCTPATVYSQTKAPKCGVQPLGAYNKQRSAPFDLVIGLSHHRSGTSQLGCILWNAAKGAGIPYPLYKVRGCPRPQLRPGEERSAAQCSAVQRSPRPPPLAERRGQD